MKRLLRTIVLGTIASFSAAPLVASTAWVEGGVYLNARSGPGTHFFVEMALSPCSAINIIGYQNGWSMIAYAGHTYWVSSRYVQNSPCGYHGHGHGHGHAY